MSQQKLEAYFKDYRHGVHKQSNDDLKEACFMTKQNVYKRQKVEQTTGIETSGPTHTKKDAPDWLKARILAGDRHTAAQTNIVADMAPHIGHSRRYRHLVYLVERRCQCVFSDRLLWLFCGFVASFCFFVVASFVAVFAVAVCLDVFS